MYRRNAITDQNEADDESNDVTLTGSILEAAENDIPDYGTLRSSRVSPETVAS
jgi:hypothetical protein